MNILGRTVKEKAYQEFKEFILIALYLWLVFGLLIVHKSLVLTEHGIDFTYHGLALINALALAKVMLVARYLHLGDQFNTAPLIYPTLVKSALFSIVLACFKILEEAAIGLYRGESFRQSIADIGGGTLKGILILTAFMFVVLVPFVGFGELRRVLGGEKLKQIFLGARPLENRTAREF